MNSKSFDWSKWNIKEIYIATDRGCCRTCTHGEYWHLRNGAACSYDASTECKARSKYESVNILIPTEVKISMCPCFEYVPGDNLAYLEWCHNKLEKKNETTK